MTDKGIIETEEDAKYANLILREGPEGENKFHSDTSLLQEKKERKFEVSVG